MGLDNVLAVAGAAHGSYVLVVTGLAISVPIVIWGSTLVLKVVERYPGVVYIGAGVLVWTAVKMIASEPLVRPWLQAMPLLDAALYAVIPLLLWAGFARNHRQLASRIQTRLSAIASRLPARAGAAPQAPDSTQQGDKAMLKVLVPVDGSDNALGAVRHAMAEYQRHHELEIHLLNVQPRLSRHIGRFLSRSDRDSWHADQAGQAMQSAKDLLQRSGVPFHTHWTIGDRATEICRVASALQAHHLVMGTARKNSLTRMLEDSVTNQVLENTPVPVEVVAGLQVSRLERWGLPAGLLGLGGLLWLAMD
jgi:nucleotide-binding universal stress UspA family protein